MLLSWIIRCVVLVVVIVQWGLVNATYNYEITINPKQIRDWATDYLNSETISDWASKYFGDTKMIKTFVSGVGLAMQMSGMGGKGNGKKGKTAITKSKNNNNNNNKGKGGGRNRKVRSPKNGGAKERNGSNKNDGFLSSITIRKFEQPTVKTIFNPKSNTVTVNLLMNKLEICTGWNNKQLFQSWTLPSGSACVHPEKGKKLNIVTHLKPARRADTAILNMESFKFNMPVDLTLSGDVAANEGVQTVVSLLKFLTAGPMLSNFLEKRAKSSWNGFWKKLNTPGGPKITRIVVIQEGIKLSVSSENRLASGSVEKMLGLKPVKADENPSQASSQEHDMEENM